MEQSEVDHLDALADANAARKRDLIRGQGVTDPEKIALLMFSYGRAHGLAEASDMFTGTKRELPKAL